MFLEIINSLVWLDILILMIIIRCIYIGLKTGMFVEFFKLLGVAVGTILSLHYFSRMAEALHRDIKWLPFSFFEVTSFIVIFFATILLMRFIRDGLQVILRVEAQATLDKWIAGLAALGRGLLLSSLLIVFFQVTGVNFLVEYSKKSLFGPHLFNVAPSFYAFSFTDFISKFFPNEQLNSKVFLLKEFDSK